MNHHYTVWQRAKRLIQAAQRSGPTARAPCGPQTKQRCSPAQHHGGKVTVWIPGEEPGATNPCSWDHMLKPFILRETLWVRGQRRGNFGLRKLTSSVFWPWWKLLQLWSLLRNRNYAIVVCRIMASQKRLKTPILSGGKQQNMHRTR